MFKANEEAMRNKEFTMPAPRKSPTYRAKGSGRETNMANHEGCFTVLTQN